MWHEIEGTEVGWGVGLLDAGVDPVGATVGPTGSGVGVGVDLVGDTVGSTGSGAGVDPVGDPVGPTGSGAGVGPTGSGTGVESNVGNKDGDEVGNLVTEIELGIFVGGLVPQLQYPHVEKL